MVEAQGLGSGGCGGGGRGQVTPLPSIWVIDHVSEPLGEIITVSLRCVHMLGIILHFCFPLKLFLQDKEKASWVFRSKILMFIVKKESHNTTTGS